MKTQVYSAPALEIPQPPGYLTKEEVAQLLKVTTRTVEAYMRQGWLPFVRLGNRTVRFRAADIDAALSTGNAGN
jgi:excisionase family DNA binding protein